MTIIKIIIDTGIPAGVVSIPLASIVAKDDSKVLTLKGEDEVMPKRTLISGRVRNKKQQREAAEANKDKDAVIVQVQLTGDDKDRFLAYIGRADFKPSNAEAGRKLMLERLAQVEAAA